MVQKTEKVAFSRFAENGPVWNGNGASSLVYMYVRKDIAAPAYSSIRTLFGTTQCGGVGAASAGINAEGFEVACGKDVVLPNSLQKRIVRRRFEPSCGAYFDEVPGVEYCSLGQSNTSAFVLWVLSYTPIPEGGVFDGSSASLTSTTLIRPGTLYEPRPGECRTSDCVNSDAGSSLTYCIESGNVHLSTGGPVTTRGYPLINNVHVNSQRASGDRAMGNGTFTYDMHLTEGPVVEGDGEARTHRLLVDGDGSRYDFGRVTDGTNSEPGIFSKLVQTGDGWELQEAAAPKSLRRAGNFTYRFSPEGRLLSIRDPANNQQLLTYVNDRLTRVEDSAIGKSLDFVWTGDRITEVREVGGAAVTALSYTEGLLTSIVIKNPDGSTVRSWSITYAPEGMIESVTYDNDPRTTKRFTYTFADGVLEGQRVPLVNNADGIQVRMLGYGVTSGAHHTATYVTDRRGNQTLYEFTPDRDLAEVRPPKYAGNLNQPVHRYFYDASRNLTATAGVDGAPREMHYNAQGQVTSVTWHNNNVTSYEYVGRDLARISDNLGTLYTLRYENPSQPNLPTVVVSNTGEEWRFSYNQFGQVVQTTPPAGSPLGGTVIEYDETPGPRFGYPIRITDGSGRVTTLGNYTPLGDVGSVTTPLGDTTTFGYDSARRETLTRYSDGTEERTEYAGRHVSRTIDGEGTATDYEFCPGCGGLERLLRPLGSTLVWNRDADFQVAQFIDARGGYTDYTRGANGEVTGMRYPGEGSYTYTYDELGRKESTYLDGTHLRRLYYDDDGYVSTRYFAADNTSARYGYRADHSLSTAEGSLGNYTYEYDPDRRVAAVVQDLSNGSPYIPQVERIEYDYHPGGLRSAMRWYHNGVLVGRLRVLRKTCHLFTKWSYPQKLCMGH
jgi:YD repeat-containing protein